MLIDTHVHVGWFRDSYYSPKDISCMMKSCETNNYLVSSTTICSGHVAQSISDIKNLINIDGNKVIPCLWVIESMLDNLTDLFSEIDWKCLKIHPELKPNEWLNNADNIRKILDVCRSHSLPLLIHTGYDPEAEASRFKKTIEDYLDVSFILAHGKPIHQAEEMLMRYPNVYVDTAFMEISDIINLSSKGFGKRLLWGTDVPIPLLYNEDIVEYIHNRIAKLHASLPYSQFDDITSGNALRLFKFELEDFQMRN